MLNGKPHFIGGFVLGALVCGSVAVYAGVYVPTTTWIANTLLYSDATDQINVLADIQPNTALIMQEVGLRFNSLDTAGKKQNWDFATYQVEEMTAAFNKLSVTRPSRKAALDAFIAASLPPVTSAIAAQDKAAFKTAMATLATDCTTCHTNSGKGFLPVKAGKSVMPIK
ncbi:MAG: hypothetical protein HY899_12430 [Deltaproteobacteria bacterium]|nr:hypothetical protein [Deltaproteobacteria bacterium]